ncbi:hypothetical protein PMAYCL1PPCAC_26891, partial [Pristionchus mayeri]
QMLAATSPFFNVLFYGNFGERKNDIFEVKEADTADFLWFLNSIQTKKWFCTSVNQALVALSYADRFGMLNLHKRISAYLKFYSLAQEDIKDALLLCSRFDNEELIVWVLGQCEDAQKRFDLVIECAPFSNMSSILSALKVLKESSLSSSAGLTACLVNGRKVPFHLRCYNTHNILESERYFSLSMDSYGNYFRWDELRRSIPAEYGYITVDGAQRWPKPDANSDAISKVSSPRIVKVCAYKS